MTLKIKKGRLRLFLYSPLCFAGFVLRKIAKNAAKRSLKPGEDFVICLPDKNTVKTLVKALRKTKKFHGKLDLLSVTTADGTSIKITL